MSTSVKWARGLGKSCRVVMRLNKKILTTMCSPIPVCGTLTVSQMLFPLPFPEYKEVSHKVPQVG